MNADDIAGLRPGDRVLVVAPHPDDETIGPGGTLARLAAIGVEVHVLCVTVRRGAMYGSESDPFIREQELAKACAALGVRNQAIAWIDETGRMDISTRQRELVDLIERHEEASLAAVDPVALIIPAAGGYHQDHQAVFRAGFAAARVHPAGLKPTPRIVLGYRGVEDRWSAVDEPWWLHVDTSDYWPAKQEALRAYATQIRSAGPRSIDQIERIDAATGAAIGTRYAESFVPYRLAF
ncbi:PIG-L deacetylase family protein [Actinoplanes regularis]|uniref:N-acetylglucosaminyl deacetylase, LmbE family n=1 Tax=Actinoplanes regularis TaxID=52697 RepID=A0A239F2B3_9ACTN|nr:PIG-L deacetylase family protein [Actinoplanes regularis]GIE89903.1 LmbE family protein [Actinoplanes regularis]SNS50302.1 N-acetylglucosaminyl deacetylase, LmbE family [Actinoplanes regularis]